MTTHRILLYLVSCILIPSTHPSYPWPGCGGSSRPDQTPRHVLGLSQGLLPVLFLFYFVIATLEVIEYALGIQYISRLYIRDMTLYSALFFFKDTVCKCFCLKLKLPKYIKIISSTSSVISSLYNHLSSLNDNQLWMTDVTTHSAR